MTIQITADGTVQSNDVWVTGSPALRIAAANVQFTNSGTGRLKSGSATVAAVIIEGPGAIVVNQAGGSILEFSNWPRSAWAIQGSAFADTIVNAGDIYGMTDLGDGADSFTQRSVYVQRASGSNLIAMGAGDDLYVHDARTGTVHDTDGGAGFDTLRITAAAYNSSLTGKLAINYERLVVEKGTSLWSLHDFSGYSEITLGDGGSYDFRTSVNPNVDIVLSGSRSSFSLNVGSLFRSITGTAGEDSISVLHAQITGSVSLGLGNDQFALRLQSNLPGTASVGGTVDGGAGSDLLTVSVETGGTYDLAQFVNFERFDLQTTLFNPGTRLRLLNLDAATQIQVFSGSDVVIADSESPSAELLSTVAKIVLESTVAIGSLNGSRASLGTVSAPAAKGLVVTNMGAIAGNAGLSLGPDVFDSTLGTVGGIIYAYAGDDHVTGSAGADRIRGGFGNDVLNGGDGDDALWGEEGNDVLSGGAGTDLLRGGTGDDLYQIAENDDIIFENAGEGTDHVVTALGSATHHAEIYMLRDNVENFTGTSAGAQGVQGNALANDITMAAGNDLVVLDQGGSDTARGGGGNDFFYLGGAFDLGDTIIGGDGIDTVGLMGSYQLTLGATSLQSVERLATYSAGSGQGAVPNHYALTAHDANVAAGAELAVIGTSLLANETLVFDGSAETDGSFNLMGGRGVDTLTGGAGEDKIRGGLGADSLRGGAGKDIFSYQSVADSAGEAIDTIHDFESVDRINLVAIDADGNASNGNQALQYIGGDAFTGAGRQLRASQDAEQPGRWIVEADIDGDGAADFTLFVIAERLEATSFWL
jgi:Ca2+-binding RTX toxin-like protein